MDRWQLWLCIILLLLSRTNARPVVESFEHRNRLTAPFRAMFEQKMVGLGYEENGFKPTRVSPGGPDPKHH
ncbi:hypothetical protein HanIR_Chr16g0835321 [Helianthus annuus]|nr:hypothetical protein HanIR_Chr16g0835321 [Helianthus annuus]